MFIYRNKTFARQCHLLDRLFLYVFNTVTQGKSLCTSAVQDEPHNVAPKWIDKGEAT